MGLHALPEVSEPHGGDCTTARSAGRRVPAAREVLAVPAVPVPAARRQPAAASAAQPAEPPGRPGTMLPSGSGPAAGALALCRPRTTTSSTMPTTTRVSRATTAAISVQGRPASALPTAEISVTSPGFGVQVTVLPSSITVAALDVTGEGDRHLGLGRLQQRTRPTGRRPHPGTGRAFPRRRTSSPSRVIDRSPVSVPLNSSSATSVKTYSLPIQSSSSYVLGLDRPGRRLLADEVTLTRRATRAARPRPRRARPGRGRRRG